MSTLAPRAASTEQHGFLHEALLHAGEEEFVAAALGFVREGLEASEPTPDSGGRGLWIANQLCGLVQVRSVAEGNIVRLHTRVVQRFGHAGVGQRGELD